MDLRRLSIFIAVAEEGGFSAAASKLHMAQPAVSIAIRKLEGELGVELFDPSARRKLLTYEGQRLLEQARQVLRQVEHLKHEVLGLRDMLAGQLTVACPSMLATYFLPDLLGQFMTLHPGLTVSVSQQGTQDIEQQLRRREIDRGVIVGEHARNDPELDVVPLVNERLCLAVGEEHEFAKRPFVRYEQLHGVPMYIYESGYFIREAFMRGCASAGVEPDLRLQANFLPLLVRMARKGSGVSLGLQLMKDQEKGLCLVPLVPASHLTLLLAKPKDKRISLANQGFFDWLVEEFRH